MRIDAPVAGAHVLGYMESDFLGFSPANAAVSSNSNSLRLRLYWVNLKKGKYEILGGQSWSLLTPNRRGLSALPSDLFYTQNIDVNYQAGLIWSRNPGVRFIYHPKPTVALGVSLEASEQYGGGSAGGGAITLPAALTSAYANEVNLGSTTFNVANPAPDVITKIAFDPAIGQKSAHFEIAGVLSAFKLYNPLSQRSYSATGGGGSFNFSIETWRNLRLIANNYASSGGGRWIFGQGPDLIVRGDGSASLIHAYSTLDGLEYQATPDALLYGYYSNAYFQRNSAIDPSNGKPVGYGYTGSPNSQNRSIQEVTFGVTRTFWKNPAFGALQLMGQYSYLLREPWFVTTGQPRSAHGNLFFLNLRYALPGAPPATE